MSRAAREISRRLRRLIYLLAQPLPAFQGGGWEGVFSFKRSFSTQGVPMNQEPEKVFNQKEQKSIRQSLRNSVSTIEKILWSKIRNQQLGVKFRRQHGIGKYIVDFYCSDFQLVIELDGDSHYQRNGH